MFCVIKGQESRGKAKVLDAVGQNFKIEYFDSPGQKIRDVQLVDRATIVPKKLGANTRVYYYFAAKGHWLVGRVIQDSGDGVEVRFTDKNDIFVDYEHLYVRCNKPIADPLDYLANLITETPQYSEARSRFMASYITQRAASWGIPALLSSVIELEFHQIDVIRRVLRDPSQRYLLADEVGLGKTIEAGVIVRQSVLDNPKNHRVVILVPRSLVQQWRQELIRRFGLIDFLDISVFVVAHESLSEVRSYLNDATLLVIDEAHHVTSEADEHARQLYNVVKNHSQHIERLLLLSATPVLRNETGFLRMLHLLDPVVYDLADEVGFRAKINNRQMLAEAVASLDPQNVLYLDAVLEELVETLPNDERLGELANALKAELISLPNENDPKLAESIRILRAHLSETYRLHRRILRNRRKQVTGLTPNRAGSRTVVIPGSLFSQFETALEDWRINAISNSEIDSQLRIGLAEFFWKVVDAILIAPGDIRSICESRISDIRTSPEFSFNGEEKLLFEMLGLVDQDKWIADRISHLKKEISNLLNGAARIVVFCSKSSIADKVYELLSIDWPASIVRHEISDDDESDGESISSRFNSDAGVRVIVCDFKSEEGINLQGGKKIVIHFDLPTAPNRIEQRMGRVDRYGSGNPIESIVLLDESSKYQSSWFLLLNQAFDVFGRSISSLQYLVEDKMKELKGSLLTDGIEALEFLTEKLAGKDGDVAKELKLIDQQDGLDELSPLAEIDLGEIFDIDADWKSILQSTLYWACETLMFGHVCEKSPNNEASVDPSFRFQYKVPGNGGHASLIALSGFLDDFMGALDYECAKSTSSQPLSYPHCSRRPSAIKSNSRLIRYGDEFIEALKSFSDIDDRGRSFGIWRHFKQKIEENSTKMFFCFDFLVESNLEHANLVIKNDAKTMSNSAISAITRRGDALFSPFVLQIWVDEDGDEPTEEFLEQYLKLPYDKYGKNGIYSDTNLKPSRFRELIELIPDTFSNWSERCSRIRDLAKIILLKRPDFNNARVAAIKRAQEEDEVREAQLATRIRMLKGVEAESERAQLALEANINKALYKGIENPTIKLDVVGVIILTSLEFPYSDNRRI